MHFLLQSIQIEYDLTISTLISTLNYEKQRTVKKLTMIVINTHPFINVK